ncbi:MAG: Imm8 family immunity protein [Gemmatimonadota bacterium]
MIYPELRDIRSHDLTPPAMPAEPADCAVRFELLVAPSGDGGDSMPGERFAFVVATPGFLVREADAAWGRGFLLVPRFEWGTVGQALAGLMARCARPTWTEVVGAISGELQWVPGGTDGVPPTPGSN